jgi:transposase-like protein
VARTTYTEADMAQVYVVLVTNEGNIKRTARDTGVPENTVRRWKQKWEAEGPPAVEVVEQAAKSLIEETEETRNLALMEIKRRIQNKEGTLAQLGTIYGILTDKIDRARGIADRRVEHVHALPSPDEIRATLGALVESVSAGHIIREEEIEDAEIIEQPALPSGS